MFVDDVLDGGESDADAWIFFRVVESLEWDEEFVYVFHVEARPIVFYIVDGGVVLGCRADLDAG